MVAAVPAPLPHLLLQQQRRLGLISEEFTTGDMQEGREGDRDRGGGWVSEYSPERVGVCVQVC